LDLHRPGPHVIVRCLAPEDGQGYGSARQPRISRPLYGIRRKASKGPERRRRRVLQNPHAWVPWPACPRGRFTPATSYTQLALNRRMPGRANPTVASRVRVIVKYRIGVSPNQGDPCASSRIPYRGHGSEGRSRVWERTRLPHVRFLAQTAARSGGNAGLACKGLLDPDTREPRWPARLLTAWHLLDLLLPLEGE